MEISERNDPLSMTNRNKVPVSLKLSNGGAAFLVCGGPSLKTLPYHKIGGRGIYSLGINNVAGYAPVRAFTFSDPPQKFHPGIFLDPALTVFSPFSKLGRHIRFKLDDETFRESSIKVNHCPNVFGYKRSAEFIAENFLTSDAATWGNNKKGAKKTGGKKTVSTMLLGLRLLHYLGFDRVYMLGVDLSMDPSESGDQYAFGQGKERGGVLGNLNSYRNINGFLCELRPVFDAAGFSVYNCNQQSGCSAFDYQPFDDALKDCRGLVPEGEIDLSGWYDKHPIKKFQWFGAKYNLSEEDQKKYGKKK